MSCILAGTVVALVALAACVSTPVTLGPNQRCDLPLDVWRQVPTPPERELLLGLPDKVTQKPIREHYVPTNVQREAWFQGPNGALQACLYDPHERIPCVTTQVTFIRVNSKWEVESDMQTACLD